MKIMQSYSAYHRHLWYKFQVPMYKNVEFWYFSPEDKCLTSACLCVVRLFIVFFFLFIV